MGIQFNFRKSLIISESKGRHQLKHSDMVNRKDTTFVICFKTTQTKSTSIKLPTRSNFR